MPVSWRRKFVAFGAGLALAGAGVAWWASSGPRAPVFNGRPISELLAESPSSFESYAQLDSAVKKLKGEAVPYLVHVLKNEPTAPQRFYQDLYFRTPQRWREHLPAPSFYQNRRGTCAALLGYTGRNGVAQIPYVARLSKEDPTWGVRANAMSALEQLGPGSEYESVALEALLAATRETDVRLAQNGYGRLGAFSNRAAEVVPVLLKGLENPKMTDSCIYALKILGGTREASVQGAIDRVAAMFSQQQEGVQRTISKEDEVSKLMELF